MASKNSTVLATYLLTPEGREYFIRQYTAEYRSWVYDTPHDDCAAYGLHGALRDCLEAALPTELAGNIEELYCNLDPLEFDGEDKGTILRYRRADALAARLDTLFDGYLDVMPKRWQ